MAHEYSVQIHDWITQKKETISRKERAAKDQKKWEQESYYKGQLEELLFIRSYLNDRIDLDTQKYYQ
ncbi:MAG: hypothetical protein L3J69_09155 [Desulfobacula sp.]|nr:hypothetical protein [Desulfobacula sp.]